MNKLRPGTGWLVMRAKSPVQSVLHCQYHIERQSMTSISRQIT